MVLSLAQLTQQRKRAALAAAKTAPGHDMAGLSAYELQLAQLYQDRSRLKNIQSGEGKAALKVELLPAYQPYISGVLEAGKGAQDEVVMTIMLWRIDAGDYAGALDIADYALAHRLVMPDRFARATGCVIAEEIAEAALKAQKTGGRFDRAILQRALELTDPADMPDEARAKLYLAAGRATLEGLSVDNPGPPGQVQAGIDLLKRAIQLHDKCGGKKDLEVAERLQKKLTASGG